MAQAVVDCWTSHRGKPAADVESLAAFPILAEIYALADGGCDLFLFGFYEIERHRMEAIHLAGEDAPREVLVFADFMMVAHEFAVDVATGEVLTACDESFVVAPSLVAFFTLYLAEDSLLWAYTTDDLRRRSDKASRSRPRYGALWLLLPVALLGVEAVLRLGCAPSEVITPRHDLRNCSAVGGPMYVDVTRRQRSVETPSGRCLKAQGSVGNLDCLVP